VSESGLAELAKLVRELHAEARRKAEAAAAWQARAEMLAAELRVARLALQAFDDREADNRPWWRRWMWTVALCVALSAQLV